jgi:hypothetical protein
MRYAAFLLASWCGAASVPDHALTPGAVLAVTKSDVCVPGYSKKVRHVPVSVKRQVFAEYKIPYSQHRLYEVDHLSSLEISGSNSLKNLWPEPYDLCVNGKQIGARTKDRLENEMHRRVCNGMLDLNQAAREIASDWISAYRKYVGELPPCQR